MKMSTIYLCHIMVCSDTEQSILIPACHSLGGACRAVCFRSLGRKKKEKRSHCTDHSDISLSRRTTHAPRSHTYSSSQRPELLSLLMLRCPATSYSYFLVKTNVIPFFFSPKLRRLLMRRKHIYLNL